MQTQANAPAWQCQPGSVSALPRRAVNLIVLHCAATPSGKRIDQGARGSIGYQDCAHVINAWHAARGFVRRIAARTAFNASLPSIGYHFVIDLDGEVFTGRHLDEIPAQAAGFNNSAVGICMVGGAERDGRFTPAQWKSLAEVVNYLRQVYGLPAAMPARTVDKEADLGYRMTGGICGHRDLSPDGNGNGLIEPFEWVKTCPGFDVRAWLARGMQPEDKNVYTEQTR